MIKIVAVGKIKEKALRTQIEEYEKRLRPFTKLEIIEVNDEVAPQSNSDSQNNQVKEKEGERILAKIKEQEYVILLDLWGEMVDSERFSKKLDQLQTYQTSNLTFVIAGSLGPVSYTHLDVYKRQADTCAMRTARTSCVMSWGIIQRKSYLRISPRKETHGTWHLPH